MTISLLDGLSKGSQQGEGGVDGSEIRRSPPGMYETL